MNAKQQEEPRLITELRQYITDVDDAELYNIAANVLSERIKAVKVAIGGAVTASRLRLHMDNLKGSNEALGEARKLKAQYAFFKGEWEKVRPVDAEEPDQEEPLDSEEEELTTLTEEQMQALVNGVKETPLVSPA
jgi:hypothetical protein